MRKVRERIAHGGAIAEVEPHQMQLIIAVMRAQLDTRHHPDAQARACGRRLVEPIHGVMVRDGDRMEPRLLGRLHDSRWRQRPVGRGGVCLQVDERRLSVVGPDW